MKSAIYIFMISLNLLAFLALQSPVNLRAQGVDLGEGLSLTAKVLDVNRTNRSLILLKEDGIVFAIEVFQNARNFDQIEKGDMLKVDYYQSIALYPFVPGQKLKEIDDAVSRSPLGEKPSGTIIEKIDVSVKILAIDTKKRSVTFELPDGKKMVSTVDESVQGMETLKVGALIDACTTKSAVISIQKP